MNIGINQKRAFIKDQMWFLACRAFLGREIARNELKAATLSVGPISFSKRNVEKTLKANWHDFPVEDVKAFLVTKKDRKDFDDGKAVTTTRAKLVNLYKEYTDDIEQITSCLRECRSFV